MEKSSRRISRLGVILIGLLTAGRSMITSRIIAKRIRVHRSLRPLLSQTSTISTNGGFERDLYKQLDLVDVDSVKRKVFYVDIGTDYLKPPLVILCGTAQTVNTFSPHFRQISKERRLIIIELRCQGMTELLSEYGTIDQHVKDFHEIIVGHLGLKQIHLAGFSFGGRVSLAIAAMHPELVGRLSVTGVPLERPALGKLRLNDSVHCAFYFLYSSIYLSDCFYSYLLHTETLKHVF
jgi:alpha/beta hydrolase fold